MRGMYNWIDLGHTYFAVKGYLVHVKTNWSTVYLSRYSAAMKEQNKASGSNAQATTTKVDNLREEFDDACYRVDQCRVSVY